MSLTSVVRSLLAVAVAAVTLPNVHPSAAPAVPVILAVPGRANATVTLDVSGSFVAAVWSAATSSGVTDIYSAFSRDGGRSFSNPVRVNSTPGDAKVNGEQPPRVALKPLKRTTDHEPQAASTTAPPEIVVLWTAKGTSGTRLVSAASTDGGRTFAPEATVPGSDAAGNRGWESMVIGPGGRLFSAWLDHRNLAAPQNDAATEHHHHEGGSPTAASTEAPAMSEMSQLFVGSLDGVVAAKGVTSGVCYCCKTSIAAGPANTLYVAWRHVYADNVRDIAFTTSRDGGRTFSKPVRVSEDHWQINGCPEDGPSIDVDPSGVVHVIWPTVITENGGSVKALFHASTSDGVHFSARQRIPAEGQANHPQLAIGSDGTLMVVWEEAGNGARRLAFAVGHRDANGRMQFTRHEAGQDGHYPAVVAVGAGQWLLAWTGGVQDSSQIHLARLS